MQYDVAVIGGGVIGLACAWRMAQAGAAVALFERGVIGREASWAAAGMLAPQCEA
ncbi:MAG: FAD-binding oxidoreductase, partial [Armatimonadota bacterium]|nr:FAD-binding oxidoreductase [Armatimonadota bacterium]